MDKMIITTYYKPIEWCFHEGGFHFRLFGYGVNCINWEMYPPLYSRRNRKKLTIGKFDLFVIKPCKPFKISIKQ